MRHSMSGTAVTGRQADRYDITALLSRIHEKSFLFQFFYYIPGYSINNNNLINMYII